MISINEFYSQAKKELLRANADKRHPFRNVVLATAKNGAPKMRTVVMRKFEYTSILIYTDERSEKIGELESNQNKAALLFWHPKKRLQIRMEGVCEIDMNSERLIEIWKNLPSFSRASYTTEKPPGTSLISPHEVNHDTDAEDGRYFTILKFQVNEMDLLQLNREVHLRARFKRKELEWFGEWLVP